MQFHTYTAAYSEESDSTFSGAIRATCSYLLGEQARKFATEAPAGTSENGFKSNPTQSDLGLTERL